MTATLTARYTAQQRGNAGVDFYASELHYLDHLVPIWRALPPQTRGVFLSKSRGFGALLAARFPDVKWRLRSPSKERFEPIVVAAFRDLREVGRRRPVVFVEHGAGQSYVDDDGRPDGNPSYSGGEKRGNVDLFLVPNATVAARNTARYPLARVEVVGCPKLDPWVTAPTKNRGRPAVVAVTFHWEYAAHPETRSAWAHFADALPKLAATRGLRLIGHAHPLDGPRVWRRYHDLGIEVVEHLGDVFRHADVLVVDNSSAGYEFAALNRPTVWLNPPWYRRHVEHGLRFWNLIPGVQVDDPALLGAAVHEAILDPPAVQVQRGRVVDEVYPIRDGSSSARAAAAIEALLSD